MSTLTEKARRILSSLDTYAILFLGAWPFIFYWQVTLGYQVLYANDIFRLFFPLHTELARALAEGRLPLWTPYLQAGFPLFAEGEIAALYPFNLIFHVLFPIRVALSYSILFHLAWASVGMYLLGRSAGFRTSAALLAGFCFCFSGFVTAHLQHAPHLAVGSWLPWLVLFQQKFWQAQSLQRNSVPWFLLSSLTIALQLLGGFPQMALLNVGGFTLLGVFGPVIWGKLSDGSKENRTAFTIPLFAQAALVTLASVILGTGLAAIQLLPAVELLGFSIRGQELSKSFFTSFSLDPSALTQFISPFAPLGAPDIGNMEFWAYLGVLPLLLAILAPLLRRDARVWLFLLLALSALALALGELNPVYQWLYYVPVLNRLRVPARFLFPFTFAVAFLAATGFQDLQNRVRDSSESLRITIVAGVVIALGAVGAIGLGYALPSEFWMGAWQWLPGVFLFLSAVTILAAWLRLAPQGVFTAAAIGLTVIDLTVFSIPFSDLNRMVAPSEAASVPRTVQTMDATQSIYRIFSSKPPASGASARAALLPNFSLQYAKQGVGIYAPLEFQWVHEYVAEMTLTMTNLMNTRYYLLPLDTVSAGDPSPFDATEPNSGLTLSLLGEQPGIPPTRATAIEVTSYTDQTGALANGFWAGEIILVSEQGEKLTLPIRLGIETADWAFDGISRLGKVNHSKPTNALAFPAYLQSVGREFGGHKYVARFDVAKSIANPWVVTSVGVRSFLPGAGLTIEKVSLIDERGNVVSLAALLHRNDLALVFRSHTAAMWENHDVLPRAFIVHEAEIVKDDQALARLRQADFSPERVVLLSDGDTLTRPAGTDPKAAADEVVITEYKSERVVLKANTSRAGYLVLTDSWYPGWDAFVDGQSAPIHRADYIFRAVSLPPGEHSIIFEYHPMSFAIGAAISGLGVLVCGVLAIWGRKSFEIKRASARG